jgi:hypothetical protein
LARNQVQAHFCSDTALECLIPGTTSQKSYETFFGRFTSKEVFSSKKGHTKVSSWESEMPAVMEKGKRNDLFEEIFNTYRRWPELERKVFSLAHYQGQSSETISRALRVDVKEVGTILQQCERGLRNSLRDFFESGSEQASSIPEETEIAADCRQDMKAAHAAAPSRSGSPDTRRKHKGNFAFPDTRPQAAAKSKGVIGQARSH